MQRIVASLLTFAASSAFLMAVSFDAKLNLSHRWKSDRAAVEARIKDNYTDDKTNEFSKPGYDTNVREIGRFVDMVK